MNLYNGMAGYIEASMVVIATGAGFTAGTVYAYIRRKSDDKWLQADLSWNAVKPVGASIPTMTHESGGLWRLVHAPENQNDSYMINCIDSGATCYPDNYEIVVRPRPYSYNQVAYIEASMVVIATGAGFTAGMVYAYIRRKSDDKWLQADLSWNAVKPVGASIPTMTHESGGLWRLAHTPASADDTYIINCIDSGATCYPDNYATPILMAGASNPLRQQILDSLKIRLQAITIANGYRTNLGSNVVEWDVTPLDPDLETLRIEYRDEAGTTGYAGVGTHLHTLPVTLRILSQNNSGLALSNLRKAAADVYECIYNDVTFGGLAEDTNIGELREDYGENADRAAGAEIRYVIEYTTAPGTP